MARRTSRVPAAPSLVVYMLFIPLVMAFGQPQVLEYEENSFEENSYDVGYGVSVDVPATAPASALSASHPSTAPDFPDTDDTRSRIIAPTGEEVPVENENDQVPGNFGLSDERVVPENDYVVTETSANPRVFFYRSDESSCEKRGVLPTVLLILLVAIAAAFGDW